MSRNLTKLTYRIETSVYVWLVENPRPGSALGGKRPAVRPRHHPINSFLTDDGPVRRFDPLQDKRRERELPNTAPTCLPGRRWATLCHSCRASAVDRMNGWFWSHAKDHFASCFCSCSPIRAASCCFLLEKRGSC